MIAQIRGQVVEKFGSSVIIDVSGVGYEVMVTRLDWDRFSLSDEAKVYTHHHVREQAEELFGFSSLSGKKLFELLISVQGIGPRGAMAILSLAEPEEVRNAIANADADFIKRASGVGKKSADRAIVDLKDKVGLPTYYGRRTEAKAEANESDEAMEALMALGYTLGDATRALADVDPKLSTAERVRKALKS
ncbi:Holliday junction branch migration protein RuvA [Candidatus Saccharibacteria bacterium]|nr:Holliday junction branch migration protein RuvA [Candidatus Saccharibacteria bacterium]